MTFNLKEIFSLAISFCKWGHRVNTLTPALRPLWKWPINNHFLFHHCHHRHQIAAVFNACYWQLASCVLILSRFLEANGSVFQAARFFVVFFFFSFCVLAFLLVVVVVVGLAWVFMSVYLVLSVWNFIIWADREMWMVQAVAEQQAGQCLLFWAGLTLPQHSALPLIKGTLVLGKGGHRVSSRR